MKKEEAMQRLASIEAETKELKRIIKECDKPMCIVDRIKTFEDACCVLGSRPVFCSADERDEMAYKKLKHIAKALNEGWVPDWNDKTQPKYYPWFTMSPFGFGDTYYGDWDTGSSIGSRLCYKNAELAKYAGKQFEELYKDLLK